MVHFLHLGGKVSLALPDTAKPLKLVTVSAQSVVLLLKCHSCTGTLKSCQQAAIDYNRRLLEGLQPTLQVCVHCHCTCIYADTSAS